MKKIIVRVFSMLCVAVIPFTFALNTAEEITTGEATGNNTTEYIIAQPAPEFATDNKTASGDTPLTVSPTTDAPVSEEPSSANTNVNSLPTSEADILALYTKVMDQVKTDRPAFKKYEFQELPSDSANREVRKGSAIVSLVLNALDAYVMSESKAAKDPKIFDKNSDMNEFPILDNTKGCLLTDTSVIKSANCERLDNGNYRITITLNDEVFPEPTPPGSNTPLSYTGAMFNPPSRAVVEGYITAYSSQVKADRYDVFYHDCTSVIEFDPQTNHLVSLKQVMVINIDASGTVIGIGLDFMQNLYNTMKCYDFVY